MKIDFLSNIAMNYPEKYQPIFEKIDKAGGVHLNNLKNIPIKQRILTIFNIWAFLFTVFYYLSVGLPKKALMYFLLSVVLVSVIDVMSPELAPFTIIIPSIIFGARANLDLYKKYKLNQDNWI